MTALPLVQFPASFTDKSATLPRRGILRRNSDPPAPRRDLAVYFDHFDMGSTVSFDLPNHEDEKRSVGSPSMKPKLTEVTASPISVRGASSQGLRSPVRGRSPLPTRDAETGDDAGSTITIEPLERPIRGVEMIDQINEHIREWSLSGDSTHSDDTHSTDPIPRSGVQNTRSTTPLTYDSLRRHQKKESKDSGRLHTPGREFTSAELKWLEYVVNELYVLIVDKALDTKSGVQYRNTFAWRFQVSHSVLLLERD